MKTVTAQMPAKEDNLKQHIEVTPFDFESDDLDEYDEMVFLDSNKKVSEEPSEWVQCFINDYFPEWETDYTLQWKIALENYAKDLACFEEAFSQPSKFPAVAEYQKSDYEIMRFLIDTYSDCAKSAASNDDRNKRNYYFLRYPKLREGLIRYHQANETI